MSCCSSAQGKDCPTRMNDGRAFTDYRPKCIVNSDFMSELESKKMIASSYDSRLYLQNNAEKIMEEQKKQAADKMLCGVCPRPFTDMGTLEPERYVVQCDTVTCNRKEVNPNGIGDGRRY